MKTQQRAPISKQTYPGKEKVNIALLMANEARHPGTQTDEIVVTWIGGG